MTTDNDTNFGPVVTTPSAFGTVFRHEKEMPSLDCDDLFPNPPRQIDESSQDIIPDTITAQDIIDDINNASSSQSMPYTDEKSQDNQLDGIVKDEDGICHFDLPDISQDKSQDTNESQSVEYSTETTASSERKTPALPNSAHQSPDGEKTPNQLPLPVVSPALSVSSYYSSAESVSSATSTSGKKKKKKKRYCATCDLHFPHKRDLLEHLKMHVNQPSIQLESLPDDNQHVQEYRDRQKELTSTDTEEEAEPQQLLVPQGKTPPHNESGGLKLKLKLSGSQNFQVVPINRLTEKSEPVKKTPPPAANHTSTSNGGSGILQPMLDQTKSPAATMDDNSLENKFFECPTMDGLDQFAEEINTEAAEDLLKKLLECGSQQHITPDNDWASNTNEFMPLDRLAYMCTVCNANYPDAMRLEDHKRLTGHNFQHPMHPPPPPGGMSQHMDMGNSYRLRPPFQQHLPNLLAGGTMPQPCGPPMNMRPNYQGYPVPQQHQQQQQRFPPAHAFNQAQLARRPPPLYRVPHSANPVNMAPFAEMNPEMYIPSSNGTMMVNGHFQPNQPHMDRPPVFLKARLQRPMQRPRTPGMHERSPNATPSPPVCFPQQQNLTRPRLVGPMHAGPHGPALKKVKQEPGGDDDCQFISAQPRPDGLPVIQSVQGGATMIQPPKDPIQLNDQITLSFKNKDPNKNPKEVANILATRGITVTHKPKPPTVGNLPLREDSPKSLTQEAVQKIQLNNSVSIISKKRPSEGSAEELSRPRPNESAFLTCPVDDCEEKFLTQEGLNRHTQRGHKLNKVTMTMKAFKCKLCPAMFSTQEGLLNHQRQSHRVLKTSADELGIPIIDLRNEETKRKLAQLGIVNYIPLNPKSTNGCFGFPIVSVQGAANPNICNMTGMGVNSLLSLGPIKQIPMRKMD